jgi:hypothetical protein
LLRFGYTQVAQLALNMRTRESLLIDVAPTERVLPRVSARPVGTRASASAATPLVSSR